MLPYGEPRTLPQGCGTSNKITYVDEESASRALALMIVRRVVQENMGKPREAMESRFYRCHTCPGWHLTSKPYAAPVRRYAPAA